MFHSKTLTILFIVSLLMAACAPQAVQTPGQDPAPVTPAPAQVTETAPEQNPAAATAPASSNWVSYRDPRYGIGFAYPCWWLITPFPTDGYFGTLSLRSIDDAYALAHTTKGEWTGGAAPEGVFLIDLGVFEGVDPAKSDVDGYAQFIDTTMEAIASSQEQIIGQNKFTVVQIKNVNNDQAPLYQVYLLRIAPDKLLLVNVKEQDRLQTNDIQGLLSSISQNPDQPIAMPSVTPHEPLIPAACAGK